MAKPPFTNLLTGDPILKAQLAAINAQGTSAQALLQQIIRRRLIEYGLVPDELAGNPNVDPLTRQLAAQATAGGVSTIAQLQEAFDRSRNARVESIAGRGFMSSGEFTQAARENLRDYERARYGAAQSLQDQLAEAQQSFLGTQQGLYGDSASAYQDALSRVVAQINAGATFPSGGQTSTGASVRAAPVGPYTSVAAGAGRSSEPKPQAANYRTPAAPRPPKLPTLGGRALR